MGWRCAVLSSLCYAALVRPSNPFSALFPDKNWRHRYPNHLLGESSIPSLDGLHAHIEGKDTEDSEPSSSTAEQPRATGRRRALVTGLTGWLSAAATCATTETTVLPARAVDNDAAALGAFVRRTEQLAYQFQPPREFGTAPTNKPLKTHLDEVNFISPNRKGYQFGITVDPVRIDSLQSFGTPEEVAAKVVLSEVNRDGVFDVTLMEDPLVVNNNKAYQLNYLSVGKRGRKRYVSRFAIVHKKLYALTAQCLEEDYGDLKKELLTAVDSFLVLDSE